MPTQVSPTASESRGRVPRAQRARSALDWRSLAPHHAYARIGRPALDAVLFCAVAVPALAIGSVIALANAIAFRSVRKVFFVQSRIGLRGREFRLIKFRTMREPPPGSSESLTKTDFESWSHGDCARVTSFGRFLRNAHLDELPQLINVVRGEMSFIGPRPEMIEVETWAIGLVPGFAERLAIKPGITGLAQVTQGYTGRDVAAYREKLAINRDYIARMSLSFDLEILARTAWWMLRGKGWDWRAQGRAAR